MTDVLIYANTFRSPELRHEVPLGVPDAFLYAEKHGTRHIVISAMEIPRLSELGLFELHPAEEFGLDDLIAAGLTYEEIREQVAVRAVLALGISSAVVPDTFPLRLADVLRAEGVELATDRGFFNDRRRAKSGAELAGVRRAQRAAESGMAAARDLLHRASPNGHANGPGLEVDGQPLTVELVKGAIANAFAAHGSTADEFIVARGAQAAVGHDMGSGPISEGETVVIDLWPKDMESACFADMTRTYVVGEIPAQVAEWHRLCLEALQRAVSEIRPGAVGRAIFDGTCDLFEAAGERTQRTKEHGVVLADGFFHGLGHGVGLEVHEQPGLGVTSHEALVAGDVVTVEPGLYRQGYGGVRLEDLILVTENGAENLTVFPYDLTP